MATRERLPVPAMRDIIKLLNDRSAADLVELNDDELQSFEALCENWRMLAEAESPSLKIGCIIRSAPAASA